LAVGQTVREAVFEPFYQEKWGERTAE